jgi:iron(III) transport system substrate-binding protein
MFEPLSCLMFRRSFRLTFRLFSLLAFTSVLTLGSLFASLFFSASAMAQTNTQTNKQADFPLTYDGADRDQKLLAAAKKEGTLTWYSSVAEKDVAPLIEPFKKKYGIEIKVWRGSTENVLTRTLTEASAKHYNVDAIHIGAPELEALHREQLLQPIYSPYFKDLIPDAVPAHKEWASTMLSVWVQAYNTNLIKKEDLPKKWEDFLNPRWKGQLGIEAKIQEWYAAVVMDMGEQKGIQFFRDVVARNGISVRNGHSVLNNMVIAGEVPMTMAMYSYMPIDAKNKGAPIDWFSLDPTIGRANGMGVARHAAHPYAALLFLDYLLSPEAQKILVDLGYVPSNTKVKSPLGDLHIKLIDPVLTLDELDKWTKSYDAVVLHPVKQ